MEWAYATLTTLQPLADALTAFLGAPVALADLPAHVWPEVAPGSAPDPVVVFSVADPLDRRAVGPEDRIFSSVPLDVRVTAQDSAYDALAPIARVIYDALHGVTNVPVGSGGVVLTAYRTGGIQYPELAGGIQYRHLGHRFQVEVN